MSKTTLRKELIKLNREHLAELVMWMYTVSKESKEYLEFYLDPDAEALYNTMCDKIAKEFKRVKYGRRSKARPGIIKQIIKKFRSFQPGDDYVRRFYVYVIQEAITAEKCLYFTEAQYRSFSTIAADGLKLADKNGYFSSYLEEMNAVIQAVDGSDYFKKLLRTSLQETLLENKLK